VKNSIIFASVCEADNVFELEVGFDVVGVDEKFDLIDMMSCRFVEGRRYVVDVVLRCENSDK
jgi:hypothetical protein